jgi:hypothetical protein
VRVAEEQRAPRQHEVEVLAAVGVDEARALRLLEEQRRAPTARNARTGE